jgi:hypothetical protein
VGKNPKFGHILRRHPLFGAWLSSVAKMQQTESPGNLGKDGGSSCLTRGNPLHLPLVAETGAALKQGP